MVNFNWCLYASRYAAWWFSTQCICRFTLHKDLYHALCCSKISAFEGHNQTRELFAQSAQNSSLLVQGSLHFCSSDNKRPDLLVHFTHKQTFVGITNCSSNCKIQHAFLQLIMAESSEKRTSQDWQIQTSHIFQFSISGLAACFHNLLWMGQIDCWIDWCACCCWCRWWLSLRQFGLASRAHTSLCYCNSMSKWKNASRDADEDCALEYHRTSAYGAAKESPDTTDRNWHSATSSERLNIKQRQCGSFLLYCSFHYRFVWMESTFLLIKFKMFC